MTATVRIEKLVHGGQGIGTLDDGRKIFVWNVLPGELVVADVRKTKHKYLDGVAITILEPSPDREVPRDEAYLSTSPWQMMTFAAENHYKQEILQETLQREHVALPHVVPFHAGEQQWQYRNKMEYSFWGDDDGLHLALFHRASHGKRIVKGSSIAHPAVDATAQSILAVLQQQNVRASQLKTVVVRCNQAGEAVAALFVKDPAFTVPAALDGLCKGLAVYFSNPKSPASVITKQLQVFGDLTLSDTLLGTTITYDVHSFFQVNLEIFSQALARIRALVADRPFIDMYAGVGAIGLSVGGSTTLIDSDHHNCVMARQNSRSDTQQVIEAPAEKALEYIDDTHVLVVDPPRAGLHAAIIDRIRSVLPPAIVYLSCNPSTQARDVALLQDIYTLESVEGYNFFPRTPHIESLVSLRKRA